MEHSVIITENASIILQAKHKLKLKTRSIAFFGIKALKKLNWKKKICQNENRSIEEKYYENFKHT